MPLSVIGQTAAFSLSLVTFGGRGDGRHPLMRVDGYAVLYTGTGLLASTGDIIPLPIRGSKHSDSQKSFTCWY
ncbi:hypothetical protein KIF59_07705 [Enterobacter cloacae subsp. cloacae]|nr:hypothetical protein [Enterobacter cloacae subsp. cloacae]